MTLTKELLDKFENVINELKETNSANDKITILRKYINDGDICTMFKYAYNPFFKYGVTSANLKKLNNLEEFDIIEMIDLLDKLRNRELTGNKAVAIVNGFINQNPTHRELLYDIFDRNLKIGMAVKQINKALGNIIPVFDVALAATFDEEWKDKYGLSNYLIQRKCNGCLDHDTLVEFEDGSIYTIGEVVEKKIEGNIKCYNEKTGKIEYQPITNWYLNKDYNDDGTKITDKDIEWYEIEFDRPVKVGDKMMNSIKLTGNHYVYCVNLKAWRRTDELDGTETLMI